MNTLFKAIRTSWSNDALATGNNSMIWTMEPILSAAIATELPTAVYQEKDWFIAGARLVSAVLSYVFGVLTVDVVRNMNISRGWSTVNENCGAVHILYLETSASTSTLGTRSASRNTSKSTSVGVRDHSTTQALRPSSS